MIRMRIRGRLTLSFLLAVLGLLGSYALLRGASETFKAAPKTATEIGPTPAAVSSGISQFPASEESVPQHPIARSRDRKRPEISRESTAKIARARASKEIAHSSTNAATPNATGLGLEKASLVSEPPDPISLQNPPAGKLPAP